MAENGASAAVVSKNAILLKIVNLEGAISALTDQHQSQKEHFKNLQNQNTKLTEDNKELKKRVGELEEWVEDKENAPVLEEVDEPEDDLAGLTPEQAAAVHASREAARSNPLKSCVNVVTCRLLGIATCAPHHLHTFNPSLAEELREKDPVTKVTYLRFDFEAPYDNDHNHTIIQKIIDFVRKHGAHHVPAAAGAIEAVSEADLLARVQNKYRLMRKEWKARGKLVAQAVEAATAAEQAAQQVAQREIDQANGWSGDEGEGAAPAQVVPPKKIKVSGNASKVQSRAGGKLTTRKRKRDALPADHQYRHQKYDSAFEPGVMSDDEDELDENGKKTKNFMSQQLVCASQELRDLWETIDDVEDPDPQTGYVNRIRGPDKDEPPKTRLKLAGRFRRWMVSTEWLGELKNKKWDTAKRIAGSGKAWGDTVDPEDEEAAKNELKRKKGKGVAGPIKRVKTAKPNAEAGPSNAEGNAETD